MPTALQSKPEVFRSEEYLLTQVRRDAWIGAVEGTELLYQWFNSTPVCINRPVDEALVPVPPNGQNPGDMLIIDPETATPALTPQALAPTDATVLPFDVDSTTPFAYSQDIPAGALGPHGFVEYMIAGKYKNNTGSPQTIAAQVTPTGPTTPYTFEISRTINDSANTFGFLVEAKIVNTGVEDNQYYWARISTNFLPSGGITEVRSAFSTEDEVSGAGADPIDTASDWTFNLYFETPVDIDICRVYAATAQLVYVA